MTTTLSLARKNVFISLMLSLQELVAIKEMELDDEDNSERAWTVIEVRFCGNVKSVLLAQLASYVVVLGGVSDFRLQN